MHVQSALQALLAGSNAFVRLDQREQIAGVNTKPPMGFNPWARFECAINQTVFTATADAIAKNGMRDAGYEWINLDDCWPEHTRTSNGSLAWNSTLFPDGFYYLRDYIHGNGLKFGVYSDAGTETCGGYPGSLNYEQIDADTFERWGIEYLKLDGCYVDNFAGKSSEETYREIYSRWHDVITQMQDPMIFSESAPAYFCDVANLTDWYEIMDWVPSYGQLARHSDDVSVFDDSDAWDSIMNNYGENTLLARVQQPGYTNDPDFIIADHGNLTLDEKKSHFGLWATFGAPLIVSAWIPDLDDDVIEYLTNKDLIAVDQDDLALQATLVSTNSELDVLTRSLANGDRLVTILNLQNTEAQFSVSLQRIGLDSSSVQAKDLWTGKTQTVHNNLAGTLAAHATAIFRLSHHGSTTPTGIIFNTSSRKCLSANGLSVTSCDGGDDQVWTVTNGVVSALSAPNKCLSESNNELSLTRCNAHSKSQQWSFGISGNIRNAQTGHCLSGTSGSLAVGPCGLSDAAVFEAPSGWLQHENP